MTDLQFLPWSEPSFCSNRNHEWDGDYSTVPILEEFTPFAVAYSNWEGCATCKKEWFDLEIGISPVCSLKGISLLDRLHDAEDISRLRLSRGMEPWRVEVHFDVYHFETDLELPWLQFHYFGPFNWPDEGQKERLSRLANTVIPYLCENALVIAEYAWPLRQPHGGS